MDDFKVQYLPPLRGFQGTFEPFFTVRRRGRIRLALLVFSIMALSHALMFYAGETRARLINKSQLCVSVSSINDAAAVINKLPKTRISRK